MSADADDSDRTDTQPYSASSEGPDLPGEPQPGTIDPTRTAQANWLLDHEQTDTVGLGYVPGVETTPSSHLSGSIGTYHVEFLRQWAELLQMQGVEMVDLRALQSTASDDKRALVGLAAGDHPSAIAPVLAASTPEDGDDAPPARITDDDALPREQVYVSVDIGREGISVSLFRDDPEGGHELLDEWWVTHAEIDEEEGQAALLTAESDDA